MKLPAYSKMVQEKTHTHRGCIQKEKENDTANRAQCKPLMNLGEDYIGVPILNLSINFKFYKNKTLQNN